MSFTYSKLKKRSYSKYLYLWQENNEGFQHLLLELGSDGRLRKGRLKEIAEETAIPYKTLESWRARLRTNSDWRPEYGHAGVPRVLSEETEDQVRQTLTENFIDANRFCPLSAVAHTLTLAGREVHGNDFTAGKKLVHNFLARQGLSLRKPHLKRRTDPNDSAVSEFLARIELVRMQFPLPLIVNVDETCWRLINGQLKTLARTGDDSVRVLTKCTQKSDLTVIAACTASGERLPLWALAKGTTPRCEEKYRSSPKLRRYLGRKLVIDHTETGWSTAELMTRYLSWLKDLKGGRLVHVLWDLHASHREMGVQEWAQNHDLGLTFVPAGQTDEWQPLDRRVFGSLKQRAMKKLTDNMVEDNLADYDMTDALKILMESWDEVTEEEIVKAWEPLMA